MITPFGWALAAVGRQDANAISGVVDREPRLRSEQGHVPIALDALGGDGRQVAELATGQALMAQCSDDARMGGESKWVTRAASVGPYSSISIKHL
jgi:hypothetical protein